MTNKLAEEDWQVLLSMIEHGKCTPFIGAGACHNILPLAKDIALEWAKEHNYPMEDIDDLGNVAQYLAITLSPTYPKHQIAQMLKNIYPESIEAIEKTHGLLAELPLPVYITTNYDDFMYRTLQSKRKNPNRVLCQWNSFVRKNLDPQQKDDYVLKNDFTPSAQEPIVFHLHGLDEIPESLVLTEDDYVDFVVNTSKDMMEVVPFQIQKALTSHSLLFIGYGLKDWSFRVLFRGLVSQLEKSLRKKSIAIQLPKSLKQESYLNKYFDEMKIKVYWGEASEFIEELKSRWNDYEGR